MTQHADRTGQHRQTVRRRPSAGAITAIATVGLLIVAVVSLMWTRSATESTQALELRLGVPLADGRQLTATGADSDKLALVLVDAAGKATCGGWSTAEPIRGIARYSLLSTELVDNTTYSARVYDFPAVADRTAYIWRCAAHPATETPPDDPSDTRTSRSAALQVGNSLEIAHVNAIEELSELR